MNRAELESFFRRSPVDYPVKATWFLYGIEFASTRCPDCPFPPAHTEEKIRECAKKCHFEIMVWILDKRQSEIYEESRSPEMKKRDFEKAIKERKMAQVEEIIGRVPELASLPLFIKNEKTRI